MKLLVTMLTLLPLLGAFGCASDDLYDRQEEEVYTEDGFYEDNGYYGDEFYDDDDFWDEEDYWD